MSSYIKLLALSTILWSAASAASTGDAAAAAAKKDSGNKDGGASSTAAEQDHSKGQDGVGFTPTQEGRMREISKQLESIGEQAQRAMLESESARLAVTQDELKKCISDLRDCRVALMNEQISSERLNRLLEASRDRENKLTNELKESRKELKDLLEASRRREDSLENELEESRKQLKDLREDFTAYEVVMLKELEDSSARKGGQTTVAEAATTTNSAAVVAPQTDPVPLIKNIPAAAAAAAASNSALVAPQQPIRKPEPMYLRHHREWEQAQSYSSADRDNLARRQKAERDQADMDAGNYSYTPWS